jgi:type III secretion protein N (ATPase)
VISHGTVLDARAGFIVAQLPGAAVGDGVRILTKAGAVHGIVDAVAAKRASVAVHDAIDGVAPNDEVLIDPSVLYMALGTPLIGRCIDARGNALDRAAAPLARSRTIRTDAPSPAQRETVSQPFWTGIRAIDGLLTIGRGARIGVFGAPGSGKSTLLHLLVRGAFADAVVIGLVGERGREAEEWMRVAPRHASIVCATSDRSAAERVRAARVAMAQAAALRKRGLHVLLILDSLARFASALRDLAVAAAEPVGRGGYPAGVFAELARYVEIAGSTRCGSITLAATVLSDGDERDPVSDASRSLLDGHIVLSPALAQCGRFPAIDVGASVSRTMNAVTCDAHAADAALVRRAIATLGESRDARALGIVPADAFAVRAIAAEDALESFLRQDAWAEQPQHTLSVLAQLADRLR